MSKSLIFEHSPWFILLCFLIAFGYAFLLYFKDKKLTELSKKKIYLLASFRFLSTFLIALLLLSPLLKSITTNVEKPIIIFASDNSESIDLVYKNDKDKLIKIQNEYLDFNNNISKKYNIQHFSFGKNVKKFENFDYSEKQTDLSNLIEQINNQFYNKNIGALIISSDGIFNSGANPIFLLENLNYPIYTIGVGDTTEHKDLLIKSITTNEIAFLNSNFPIEINISAIKLNSENVTCNITNNGKIIYTENFEINSNNFSKKIIVYIEAKTAGVQQYTINLNKISNERNIINNTKSIAINIVENKQKILLLANSPHPDIAAIRAALSQNSNYTVDFFTVENFNAKISDYSLIILHQLPSVQNKISNIFAEIISKKIPILFILGNQLDVNQFNTLNTGVKINQSNAAFDDVQGLLNTSFSDFEVNKNLSQILSFAPPLSVHFGTYQVAPQYKTILYQKVKNIATSKPLVLITNSSPTFESSIAFIMGEGVWRWRMYEFNKNQSFTEFDNFLNQLTQYLVLKLNKNRFIVKCEKIILTNSDIVFKAESYNKIYELVNENDVFLKITDSTGKNLDYIFQRTEKSYTLNIGFLPAGNYNYIANTKIGDENFSAKGSFVIINANIEAQNLVADFNLLKKISQKTSGKFVFSENIDSLNYYIDNNPNIVSLSYTMQDITDILKFKWIFFFILSILTVEWFLRKFWGTY